MVHFKKYGSIIVLLFAVLGLIINGLIAGYPSSLTEQYPRVYNEQYYRLKKFLLYYDSISICGGWIKIPERKEALRAGSKDSVISMLRKRLEAENYLMRKATAVPDSFSNQVTDALKAFQKNNGLISNGNLDPATIAVLNIPAWKRVEEIKVNIERWKTFSIDTGNRYLLVNVPDFNLELIENDSIVMNMKAIVGRSYRKTPIFNAKLTHVIFNPSWHVPSSIIKKDILPFVLKDTSSLRKKHIRIYQSKEGELQKEVPVDSVNWKAVSIKHFPYKLIQDPGKDNALGVVKFIFPNPYNVYMHDTPGKELFAEIERTFSSGCIRISNAVGLAEQLLKGEWSKKKIMQTIQSGKTVTVILAEPVNIYIVYFTAWVDANGSLQFRKDIYCRDFGTF